MLRQSEYSRWWRELDELLDEGDLGKFWQHYAAYLLRTGVHWVHSDARKTLLQAAMTTAGVLIPPTADSATKCECHERDSSYVCAHCYALGYRGHMQE